MLTLTVSVVNTGPWEIYRWGRRPPPRLTPGPVDTQGQILHWDWFETASVSVGVIEPVLNPTKLFRERSVNQSKRETQNLQELPVIISPLQLSSINNSPTTQQ